VRANFSKKMYYTYILQSVKNGRYYIGSCANVPARLKQHNSGVTQSTAPHRPYILKRVEEFETRTEARKRENFLKSKKSKKIIELIIKSPQDK